MQRQRLSTAHTAQHPSTTSTTQKQHFTARDEFFANGDLVFLLKGCFTKDKYALNRRFLQFAKRKQMHITPVAVRANVDLEAYRRASYRAVPLSGLTISDIEWTTQANPTAEFDLIDFLTSPESAMDDIDVRRTMTAMIDANAPHLRRLRVHMALNVSLTYAPENAALYRHIDAFLGALSKCTAMESLTVVQTDHVARNAKLATVQCRLFHIINTMPNLKVLDFNGNMTIEATGVQDEIGITNQLTIFDYLPESLCELTIRDGAFPRMYKWREFYGFSAGLKLAMSNHGNRFPSLKKIALPSSFWSLPPHVFGGFMRHLNSKHVTHIGVSDPFKLKTGPTKPGIGDIMPLPAPYLMLHYLIATLAVDMVLDLRGACHVERLARIQWALDAPQTALTSFLAEANKSSDGGTYTTVTMRKKNETTLRVLI